MNFKNIDKAKITPSNITLFIGPNGSGKSSILQSLILLKQSAEQQNLVVSGNLLRLGTLKDIIRKGAQTLRIMLNGFFTPDLYEINRLKLESGELDKITYIFNLETIERGLNSLALSLESEPPIETEPTNIYVSDLFNAEWNAYEGEYTDDIIFGGVTYSRKISSKIGNPFDFSLKGRSREREIRDRLILLQILSRVFERQLDEIHYVPASRGFTRPYYGIEDRASRIFYSQSSDRQNSQVATTLGIQSEYEEIVSNWMKHVTGVKIRPNLGESKQIGVGSTKEELGLNISIINEGFGTNQLVQLFLTLAIADNGSTILIEEPEIHLHPKAQSKLSELLVNISKKFNKQLMITTHSEHILFRLLSMIKNGKLKREDVAIYHFEDKKGTADIKELEINEHGQIIGGLQSFFEAEIEEFGLFFKEETSRET